MSKAINRIAVNALYSPAPASHHEQAFSGYLKASITDIINVEAERRVATNAYYPLIFVPFTMSREEEERDRYTLGRAFEAKDVTPAYLDIRKKTWEFSYLKPPQREQERLRAILLTLAQNLETIVEQARPLRGITKVRRRRFLAQFPQPLREGLEEKIVYGTISKKPILFRIYQHNLASYTGEDKIPQGVLPSTMHPRLYLVHAYSFYKRWSVGQ